MFAEIAATVTSVKNLSDFVGKMKESTEKNNLLAQLKEVNTNILQLQSVVMETKQTAMIAEKRATDAEAECVRLKNWALETERYQLAELAPGAFAYAVKPGMEQGEPPHHLCANCYAKGQKSLLQYEAPIPQAAGYSCHRCDTKIRTGLRGRR